MGGDVSALTPDSVDSMITVNDPFSEKIIALVAKYNALEDCMGAVKKGFEKDAIPLSDFLHHIRALSVKQCKKLQKMEKIDNAINSGSPNANAGYGDLG